jgi:hypothetical protein
MERKRKSGRFVREGDGVEGSGEESVAKKPAVGAPRPRYCRTYTRKRVAEALPEIVDAFAEEAKKGSVAHMKMLTNLGGLDQGEIPTVKKRRGENVVGRLLRDWKKLPVE